MEYKLKLRNIIKEKYSNLIIGLDTDINKIPLYFLKYRNPEYEFNKKIINLTKSFVAGYKFNMAFYEAMMDKGFDVLRKSLKIIPDNCVTICDAKRGDILNTNELYSRVYFDNLNFDAITLSPYMGAETIYAFVSKKWKFAYILALTSNSGSKDFQKLIVSKKYLFEIIIDKFLRKYGTNKIGFVFGANYAREINKITEKHRDLSLLIPGIGAQGNDLRKLIKSINNKISVINSSRAIIYENNLSIGQDEFNKSVLLKTFKTNNAIRNPDVEL